MTANRITVLVTAYKEPDTITRALQPIISQSQRFNAEIIVICPDDATAHAVKTLKDVRVLRDPGKGKPEALNIGLANAHGDIVILTDGDVFIGDHALQHLIKPFTINEVGAVSGRPISTNPRHTMLGFWSHLLTDAGAHQERKNRDDQGKFFVCSGYLYAFRRSLVKSIPEDALAEDAVVSHMIGEAGHQIHYAPQAEVFVQYPSTYKDWLIQKVRSAGGYAQPIIASSQLRMRSFKDEVIRGTWRALTYPQNLREFLWTLALFGARLHLWLLILWRVRIRRLPLETIWKRVESTKGV